MNSTNMERIAECVGKHHKLTVHDEVAPGNQDPALGGVKFDHGKPNVADMLSGFANAIQAVSRLYDHGTDKYAKGNWSDVEGGVDRYSNAMQRHFIEESTDGEIDEKSGELHATAVAWNALCRLELILRETDE